MTAPRSPFEQTIAITAAGRDIDLDTARAAVIAESVQWIIDHVSATDQDVLASAIRAVASGLSEAASDHSDRAERYWNAAHATDPTADDSDVAYAANLAMSAAISSVATALNTTGPF